MLKLTQLKLFNKIFFNSESKGFGWKILFLLILQQVLAASSSVWITQFATNIQIGHQWKVDLILFLTSMVLPYFPGALALHVTNLWINSLQRNSTHTYLELVKGRTDIVNNNQLRHVQTSVIAKEIPQFIQDSIPFSIQYASQWLNLIFQLMTVSLILGTPYLLTFVAGVFIVFRLLEFSKLKNELLAKKKQNSLTNISALLSESWGNLTISNNYNLNLWKKRIDEAYEEGRINNSAQSIHKEFGGALVSLLGIVPFVFYIGFHFLLNNPSTSELITFSVLLPRIFQLFNISTSLSILTKNISALVGRWKDIEEKSEQLQINHVLIEKRINIKSIEVRNNSTSKLIESNDLYEVILNQKTGYFKVTGPNGSGKSSFLLDLKGKFRDEAIYLPANADLAFENLGQQVLSTGQKMRLALEEIINLPEKMKPRVFLLDEWDANLDQSARQSLVEKLFALSESHLVIEICHNN